VTTTLTPTDTTSIKSILAACEAFEAGMPAGVISRDAERNIRSAFEAEARQALVGITRDDHDTETALRACDTVDEMKAALLKAVGGDIRAARLGELFREVRLDTEKMFGHWGYEALTAWLGPWERNAWANKMLACMNRKGVCVTTTPDVCGCLVGYRQHSALHAMAALLGLASTTAEAVDIWAGIVDRGTAAFDERFRCTTTVYKNGGMVFRGLDLYATHLAYAFADYLHAWKEASR